MAALEWCVYILRCGDGTLYTGMTNDLPRRLATHEAGRGARYTKGRGPLALVYVEVVPDRRSALKREVAIKKLPVRRKRELLGGWSAGGKVAAVIHVE